jgi:hypothetical protein
VPLFAARVRRASRIVIGAERLRADPLFDPVWYRWANPDAPRSARGSARHYAFVGVDEFRSPSVDFSAARYAAGHPDVADSGLSPLVHYLRFGRREGRRTWSHYERFFMDADGRLDRDALESFLRSGALTEGRGSVLRAAPHLLHAMPRGMSRAFGDILVALANDRAADLGPVLVTGPVHGSVPGVAVSILGEPGILATATLAALLVGAEVGQAQIASPGEPVPDGEVLLEVPAGALVIPGSIGRLALHARRGGTVVALALHPDGTPWQSWTDDDAAGPPVPTAALASGGIAEDPSPRVVRGAGAVWWPEWTPPDSQGARPRQRPRALVLDASVPTPDLDSGSLSSVSYARTLVALGYRVVFVPLDLRHHRRYTPELESWGVEVVDERFVGSVDEVFAAVPFELALLIRPAVFTDAIGPLQHAQPAVRVLFAPLDLSHARLAAEAVISGDARLAAIADRIRDQELANIARADATILASSTEVERVRRLQPGACVAQVPMARERSAAASIDSWSDRHDLVFVGSYAHSPNVDALRWFLDEVWPKVAGRLPDARFIAYGSGMPDELQARATDRIVMHGHIEQLEDAFATARISVVPLRFVRARRARSRRRCSRACRSSRPRWARTAWTWTRPRCSSPISRTPSRTRSRHCGATKLGSPR